MAFTQMPEMASADVNGFVGVHHGLPYGHLPPDYAAAQGSLGVESNHRMPPPHHVGGHHHPHQLEANTAAPQHGSCISGTSEFFIANSERLQHARA